MAKKFIGFKATEAEVNFLKQKVRENNTNVTFVIKKLIRDAMEGKELENQTKILKAGLERLEEISMRVAESAIFAEHMAIVNYEELVQNNEEKIEKAKDKVSKLTEADMEEI